MGAATLVMAGAGGAGAGKVELKHLPTLSKQASDLGLAGGLAGAVTAGFGELGEAPSASASASTATAGEKAGAPPSGDVEASPPDVPPPEASASPEKRPAKAGGGGPPPVSAAAGARPLGLYYSYDDATGQLTKGGRVGGEGGPKAQALYVEKPHSGAFARIGARAGGFRPQWRQVRPKGADDTDFTCLRQMTEAWSSVFSVAALFAQGLAGGLALLTFYFTYMRYGADLPRGFLATYSAVSADVNRTYYVLLSVSFLSAVDKYCKDQAANFVPLGGLQRNIDGMLVLIYLVAFVLNILTMPMDDMLNYTYRRAPDWYEMPLNSTFKDKLAQWHVLNALKLIFCGVGWLLVAFELRPAAVDNISRHQSHAFRKDNRM